MKICPKEDILKHNAKLMDKLKEVRKSIDLFHKEYCEIQNGDADINSTQIIKHF